MLESSNAFCTSLHSHKLRSKRYRLYAILFLTKIEHMSAVSVDYESFSRPSRHDISSMISINLSSYDKSWSPWMVHDRSNFSSSLKKVPKLTGIPVLPLEYTLMHYRITRIEHHFSFTMFLHIRKHAACLI